MFKCNWRLCMKTFPHLYGQERKCSFMVAHSVQARKKVAKRKKKNQKSIEREKRRLQAFRYFQCINVLVTVNNHPRRRIFLTQAQGNFVLAARDYAGWWKIHIESPRWIVYHITNIITFSNIIFADFSPLYPWENFLLMQISSILFSILRNERRWVLRVCS